MCEGEEDNKKNSMLEKCVCIRVKMRSGNG